MSVFLACILVSDISIAADKSKNTAKKDLKDIQKQFDTLDKEQKKVHADYDRYLDRAAKRAERHAKLVERTNALRARIAASRAKAPAAHERAVQLRLRGAALRERGAALDARAAALKARFQEMIERWGVRDTRGE